MGGKEDAVEESLPEERVTAALDGVRLEEPLESERLACRSKAAPLRVADAHLRQ